MKKYFVIALSVVALAACSKVSPESPVNQVAAQKEVTFQAYNYASQTKANSLIDQEGVTSFHTYAFYNPTEGTQQAFMTDETISWNSTDKVWAPSRKYYWQKTGDDNFISFYYTNSKAPSVPSDKNLKWENIEVASDDNFLFADEAFHYNANVATYNFNGAANGVPTLFHHALAQVAFKVKMNKVTDGDKYTWKAEMLSGNGVASVLKKGSLILSNAGQATTGTKAWSNSNTSKPNVGWIAGSVTEDFSFATPTLTTTTAADLLAMRTVMPQSLADATVITLKFKLYSYYDGASTPESVEVITVEKKLTELVSTITDWNMNTKYTYTITIDPSTTEVLFDPAVEAWGTGTGSYTYPES